MHAEFDSPDMCCDSSFEAGQPSQKKQTVLKIQELQSSQLE
jgi:hypothetical protein